MILVARNQGTRGCVGYVLQLEVASIIRYNFVPVVMDVGEQLLMQLFPAGALQDFGQLLFALDGA